jgi:hypothetical protein
VFPWIPWLNPKPTFNFELTQYKTSETNPLLIQQHFAEVRSVTSEYSAIYTDGSKDGDRVASAAVDTYMTRDPCENYMFTNSNKAFYKFQQFLE